MAIHRMTVTRQLFSRGSRHDVGKLRDLLIRWHHFLSKTLIIRTLS